MKRNLTATARPGGRMFGGALKALVVIGSVALALSAQAATKRIGSYTWTYVKVKGGVQIGDGSGCAVLPYNVPTVSGAVKVPAKIGKLPVKSIANKAFFDCTDITSITIPKGVTRIGVDAFHSCTGLTAAALPSTLKNLDAKAFYGCSSLKTLAIPNGVKAIEDSTFLRCTALTSVSIPSSVKYIGASAFSHCESLATISVPASVARIGEQAFYQCTSLKTASISAKVIEAQAFVLCGSLTDVDLYSGVESIGEEVFQGCINLERIALPHSLTAIGNSVFPMRNSLRTIFYEVEGDDVRLKSIIPISCHIPNTTKFKLRCKLAVKPNSKKHGTASLVSDYGSGASAWIVLDDSATAPNAMLIAKPKKGKAFAGWYQDKACKKPLDHILFQDPGSDYRQKNLTIMMPRNHITVYAKFITKAADKKALKFSSATKKLAKTAAKFRPESRTTLKIVASSASLPSYSAKGLPAGLTIDSATGAITGKPSKPGKYTATVTVKSAGGNKITQKVKITVYVEKWAQGAYAGYARPSTNVNAVVANLSFSISDIGKVTGKVSWKGKAYPFTAQCFYSGQDMTKFSPSIKIGKTTYKPGTVMVSELSLSGGLVCSVFADTALDSGAFCAYKKAKLVAGGGDLQRLLGTTATLTEDCDDSGLEKVPIVLNLKFSGDDMLEVKGKVNGNPVSFSTQLCLKGMEYGDMAYVLAAPIVIHKYGYCRALWFDVFSQDGVISDIEMKICNIEAARMDVGSDGRPLW